MWTELLSSTSLVVLLVSLLLKILKKRKSHVEQKKKIAKVIKLEEPKQTHNFRGPIHVYYASQSGTSANFAEELSRLLLRENLVSFVHNLNKFSLDQFMLQKNVVLLLSTHYDGDPPDDCGNFLKQLKDPLHKENLSKKNFCIFGLGDVTYDRFNEFAKQIDRILAKRGANSVLGLGLGSDHEGNIEVYFDKWKRKCVRAWKKQKLDLFRGNLEAFLETQAGPPEEVRVVDSKMFVYRKTFLEDLGFGSNNLLKTAKLAKILGVKELRKKPQKHERTLLVSFLLEQDNEFETGQNIAIFPKNSPENVRRAAEMLRVDLKAFVIIEAKKRQVKIKTKVPHGTPIKVVLEELLDLKGQVKANQVRRIRELEYLSGTVKDSLTSLLDDPSEMASLAQSRFGILDFLTHFKVELHLKDFLEICEVMRPRIFTICKSSNVSPQRAELVISTKHDRVPDEARKWGNTSDVWTGVASEFFIELFEYAESKEGLGERSMRYIMQDSSFKVKVIERLTRSSRRRSAAMCS